MLNRIATLLLLFSTYLVQAQTIIKPTAATAVGVVTGTALLPEAYLPASVNYERTWEPQRPYQLEADVFQPARTVSEVARTTQYLDGLARPIQTVSWQGSP